MTHTKNNSNNSYVNSGWVRWYQSDIFTVKPVEGITIKKITIHTGDSKFGEITVGTTTVETKSATPDAVFDGLNSTTDIVISNSAQIRFSYIEIDYEKESTGDDRLSADLAFAESEYTFTIGEDFTSPTLTNPNNLTVTFTSSNEEVATVNENGQLTLKSHGQTEITATSASTETYAAGKASYILHVIDPNVIYTSELGDDFTFSNPESLEVWKHNATYGLKGSAYISSTTNAAEAIAASPEIDLTNSNSISLSFKNAFNNYMKDNTMIDVADFSGYAYVLVKEAGATDWTELCVPTAPTAFSWTFFDNDPIDLSAYSGKKIQIGFKYVSTAEVAGTWEINNIVITGKPVAPEVPVVTIDGVEVTDSDQVIDLKESSVTVTITAPEGNYIYYKYVVQSAPAAVRAAEAANDFTLVENNVADVTVDKNGTLYFYTHHVASGLDSDVQTLAFTGETTSLTEIEGAESAASEWYDLQGRRVARPAKGGVYIRKQGSAITKLAL